MTLYNNHSWVQLPPNIQAAAQYLGYDQYKWDNDIEPEACQVYFVQLNPTQQQAAMALGYNAAAWDSS